MAVHKVERRGKRRLIIDIRYTKPDGTPGRYRKDAEVQTLAAARAEDRRRLAALALTGSPLGALERNPTEPARHDEPPREPLPTFEAVAKDYLADYAVSRLKPSTRVGYEAVLNGFLIPRIGYKPIDTIDASTVRELDKELVDRGVKPATRRQMQSVLRSVLCRYAVEAGLLPDAPSFPRLPRSGRKISRVLTDDEVDRVIDVSKRNQRVAFLLAARAGLRAGEIRGLHWRDVDLRAGQLTVRESVCRGVAAAPKSGHERVVPLTSDLERALKESHRQDRTAAVALNGRGAAWTEYSLLNAFRRACARAGVGSWRFHDLRHYFVTGLFRAGVPAPTVQALAGHSELTTTQHYAHVVRTDLRDAINRFDRGVLGNDGVTPPDQA